MNLTILTHKKTGPFAGILLADAGASVLRIDRTVAGAMSRQVPDLLARHKSSIVVDLKNPSGVALIRELAKTADVLIDPYRPGVLEKLGLGPEVLCTLNPRLIYGRLTGFRRDGKYANMAGHDINYLAVSGALSLLGRKGEKPTPPMNILGDFAGGGSALFQGILLALAGREKSGKGQVVEANIVDGTSYLATFPRFGLKTPLHSRPRGENLLDTGCPYYDTYETADGKYMSVGALEPQFFRALIKGLNLPHAREWEQRRVDPDTWPELRSLFEKIFRSKTRAEWEAVFDGTDACCTPVLEYGEMEADKVGKEGDQRPVVTLRSTPLLAVRKDASDASHGQGPGVRGEGYAGTPIAPGKGGVETLGKWLGWKEGREFAVGKEDNGFVLLKESKL